MKCQNEDQRSIPKWTRKGQVITDKGRNEGEYACVIISTSQPPLASKGGRYSQLAEDDLDNVDRKRTEALTGKTHLKHVKCKVPPLEKI